MKMNEKEFYDFIEKTINDKIMAINSTEIVGATVVSYSDVTKKATIKYIGSDVEIANVLNLSGVILATNDRVEVIKKYGNDSNIFIGFKRPI